MNVSSSINAIAIFALLLQTDSVKVSKKMSSDQILKQYDIRLQAGHEEVSPANSDAVVDKANAQVALEGMPLELNMLAIDKHKVKAFIEGLSKLPADTLEKLRGKTLVLADQKLQLTAYSAAILDKGYTLNVNGAARLTAPLDTKLARQRADKAKHAMEEANREVGELDKRKSQPNADSSTFVAHSNAERKRYSSATVWRNLVTALATDSPTDHSLQAEAAQAKEAASKYITAPWTGMP